MTDKTDNVNHPGHYNWHPSGVEAIEIIEAFPYNVAAAMKYLWRHQHKGCREEDLRKALWHVQRELERLETERACEETRKFGSLHEFPDPNHCCRSELL